jgi:hypothetical protein
MPGHQVTPDMALRYNRATPADLEPSHGAVTWGLRDDSGLCFEADTIMELAAKLEHSRPEQSRLPPTLPSEIV